MVVEEVNVEYCEMDWVLWEPWEVWADENLPSK